jgi:hypothetical protein
LECRIEEEPDGISLVTVREAPGVRSKGGASAAASGFFGHLPRALVQRVKLCGLRPVVEFQATFHKEDTRHAEAIYFAFPFHLPEWSVHYDAAGVPTKWDEEQLDGSCKNWVTTGAWICVHNAAAAVTLATPDAPLVQVGDFGFGRPQGFARRRPKPLLLGWVANNYWTTNYRPAQPGLLRFRYELRTHATYDPVLATHAGLDAACPVEVHPVMSGLPPARQLLRLDNPAVVPLQLALGDDGGDSLILILQNVSSMTEQCAIELPGLDSCRIYQSNALGERGPLMAEGPAFSLRLSPRATSILRIEPL